MNPEESAERLIVLVKERKCHRSLKILYSHLADSPHAIGFGPYVHTTHQTGYILVLLESLALLAGRHLVHIGTPLRNTHGCEILHLETEPVQRVRRDVHTHQLLLLLKHLYLVQFVQYGQLRPYRLHLVRTSEETVFHGLGCLLIQRTVTQQQIQTGLPLAGIHGKRAPVDLRERIKSPAVRQSLHPLLIDRSIRNPLHEIEDVLERAAGLAHLYDAVHRSDADTLDTCHAETDVAVLVNGELGVTLVDIRPENLHAVAPAVIHELGDLVDIVEVVAQDGGHVLSPIVSFQVTGLVAYPCVAGGMGLVEGVGRKCLPVVPYLIEYGFGMSVLQTSGEKLVL